MENVFKSFATEIYRCGSHVGYHVKFKHVAPLCKKWSRNRLPDEERIQEMCDYYKSGGYIPRIIHIAELKDEGLVCYDGNHRREVLNRVQALDAVCIVDVIFNATNDDVYQSFLNVNKAVDVPEIFLEESSDIKDEVLKLVKKYETKYKSFISKSSKCRSPNFNRDLFTDNVTKIYKYLDGTKSIQEIEELLEKLNREYANNKLCKQHSNYKQHIIEKCKNHNLWLFLEREIPCEHVERIVSKRKFGIFK